MLRILTSFFFITIIAFISLAGIQLNKKIRLLERQQNAALMLNLLKTYDAYDHNGPLNLVRLGGDNDGGYVVSVKALEASEALLGYGIANDISFEEAFSNLYHKPSYGFDCTIDNIVSTSSLFTLNKECISSTTAINSEPKTELKFTSFNDQIKNLQLESKKIFIKMDIEGAEYQAFEDIIPHHQNITGIAMELHVSKNAIKQANDLLAALRQHFVLIHVHGNNDSILLRSNFNMVGHLPSYLELTFINKSLVTDYQLSKDQSHPLPIDMPNIKGKPEIEFEIL